MVSLRACVEVKVIRAVKKGQAFVRVLDAMAVDDVHDYGNALAVGVVYQCLEFIRGAEAGTQGKEIGHLIAEGAVIGMLLQSHDLDGVVAEFLNARKDIPAEFLEGAHFLLFSCHADVALVDEGMGALAGMAVLPFVRLFRSPYLGAEHLCDRVLNHAGGVGGDALPAAAGPLYEEFIELSVPQEHLREVYLPVAGAGWLQGIGLRAFPVVEITNEVYLVGVGGIFTEHPAV